MGDKIKFNNAQEIKDTFENFRKSEFNKKALSLLGLETMEEFRAIKNKLESKEKLTSRESEIFGRFTATSNLSEMISTLAGDSEKRTKDLEEANKNIIEQREHFDGLLEAHKTLYRDYNKLANAYRNTQAAVEKIEKNLGITPNAKTTLAERVNAIGTKGKENLSAIRAVLTSAGFKVGDGLTEEKLQGAIVGKLNELTEAKTETGIKLEEAKKELEDLREKVNQEQKEVEEYRESLKNLVVTMEKAKETEIEETHTWNPSEFKYTPLSDLGITE